MYFSISELVHCAYAVCSVYLSLEDLCPPVVCVDEFLQCEGTVAVLVYRLH